MRSSKRRTRSPRPSGSGIFLRYQSRCAAQVRRRGRSVTAGPVPRHPVAVQGNLGVPGSARGPSRPDRRSHHHAVAERARETRPQARPVLLDQDACCDLRDVLPLARELEPFAGWVSGRKRYQGAGRADIPVVEADGGRLKFNPLAPLTPAEISAVFADAGLPRHPQEAAGYRSIGCIPCTRAARSETPRPAMGAGVGWSKPNAAFTLGRSAAAPQG